MSVGLLLITHHRIGEELLRAAVTTFAISPLSTRVLGIPDHCDPDLLEATARRLANEVDAGDGLLVLTDIYGSTPSNIATRLLDRGQTVMVAGLSLPMLIRIMNYPSLDLEALARKAVGGAHDGVIRSEPLSEEAGDAQP